MENLQKIVIQVSNGPFVRSLVQYGDGIFPTSQKEIIYSELTDEEKIIWDDFINLMNSKSGITVQVP